MDWKTPITREEYRKLTDHSRIASIRGRYKAKKRYITFTKRAIQYRQRAVDDYQLRLAHWYLTNF